MNNQIKERPILFSAPMIRALLDGRKSQTRRIAKVTDDGCKPGMITPLVGFTPRNIANHISYCPYGKIGDRLWVRETFCIVDDTEFGGDKWIDYRATPRYSESHPAGWENEPKNTEALKWKPSIHMPRWASRILLEITNVSVERLNDISEEDAVLEGIEPEPGTSHWKNYDTLPGGWRYLESPIQSYRTLWESINGQGSWNLNPFCWVIEFRRILTR